MLVKDCADLTSTNVYHSYSFSYMLGIYKTWAECSTQVTGCPGAKFKGFETESQARDFIGGNTAAAAAAASFVADLGLSVAKRKAPERKAEGPQPVKRRKVQQWNPPSDQVSGEGLVMYFDGGSRNNPGPSGSGSALYWHGKLFWQGRRFLGIKTNNEAEYEGLLHGLRYASTLCDSMKASIVIYGDSKLVIKQVLEEWKVNQPHLKILTDEAKYLLRKFSRFQLRHVLRDGNKMADSLANEAMDEEKSWDTSLDVNLASAENHAKEDDVASPHKRSLITEVQAAGSSVVDPVDLCDSDKDEDKDAFYS